MPRLRKARLLVSLGSLSGLVWAGTFATFTDSGTADSTFTAGTVDILLSGETDDAYAFTSLEMANMKPGDVKYAALTVANSGTLGFSYTMATSATNTDSKGCGSAVVTTRRWEEPLRRSVTRGRGGVPGRDANASRPRSHRCSAPLVA